MFPASKAPILHGYQQCAVAARCPARPGEEGSIGLQDDVAVLYRKLVKAVSPAPSPAAATQWRDGR